MLGHKKTWFSFFTVAVLSLGLAFGCGEKKSRSTPLKAPPQSEVSDKDKEGDNKSKTPSADGSDTQTANPNQAAVEAVSYIKQCERFANEKITEYQLTGQLSEACKGKKIAVRDLENLCVKLEDNSSFAGCTDNDKSLDKELLCEDIKATDTIWNVNTDGKNWPQKMAMWKASCDKLKSQPPVEATPAPATQPPADGDGKSETTPNPETDVPPAGTVGEGDVAVPEKDPKKPKEPTTDGEEDIASPETPASTDDAGTEETEDTKEYFHAKVKFSNLKDKEDDELGENSKSSEIKLPKDGTPFSVQSRSGRKVILTYIDKGSDAENLISITVSKIPTVSYGRGAFEVRIPAKKKATLIYGTKSTTEGTKIEFTPDEVDSNNELESLNCEVDASKDGQDMTTEKITEIDDERTIKFDTDLIKFSKKTIEVTGDEVVVTLKSEDLGFLKYRSRVHPFRFSFKTLNDDGIKASLKCGDQDLDSED